MQTLASHPVLGSSALHRKSTQLRPSRTPVAGARLVRLAPRAQCGSGGGGFGGGAYGRYGGFNSEQAMRMMEDMARQMNGAGFVFPGGRVWFGVDLEEQQQQAAATAAAAGACGAEQRPGASAWRLPVDMFKQADAYVITADIPGVSKEDLTIKFTAASPPKTPAATLLIRGTRKPAAAPAAEGDAEPLMRERRRGEFERRVALPDDAASSGITARVKEGVLTVRVPRVARQPAAQESDIPIM